MGVGLELLHSSHYVPQLLGCSADPGPHLQVFYIVPASPLPEIFGKWRSCVKTVIEKGGYRVKMMQSEVTRVMEGRLGWLNCVPQNSYVEVLILSIQEYGRLERR